MWGGLKLKSKNTIINKAVIIGLIAIIMLSLLPRDVFAQGDNVVDSGTCGDNLTWELAGEWDNLTLIISGTGDMDDYSPIAHWEMQPPWYSYINSITVIKINKGATSIGFSAFHGCSNVTTVDIPNSVTTIGSSAFKYCSNLESATIPDGVENLGEEAFAYCEGMKSITLPSSLKAFNRDTIQFTYPKVINYKGTKKQWSAITGEIFSSAYGTKAWIHNNGTAVKCNDGDFHLYDSGKIVSEATCSKKGVKRFRCTLCNHYYDTSIAKNQNHSYNSGVVTKPARNGKSGVKTYTCLNCGGKKEEKIPPCTNCNGTGKVLQDVEKTETKKCTACSGTGEYSREEIQGWIKCDKCNGAGRISTPVTNTCYTCNGTGKLDKYTKCRECSGKGWKDGGLSWSTCSKCKGEKKVFSDKKVTKRYSCGTCSGTGKEVVKRYTVKEYVVCSACGGNDNYILYNANGGKNAPKTQTIHTLKTITLSNTVPTKSKYVFEGWTLKKDGAVKYQPGQKVSDLENDITLYAKWKSNDKIWKRLWGQTALDTMTAITKEFGKSDVAVVATNDDFKDALSASALAGRYNAPILMTASDKLSPQTKSELKRMGVKTVYIIGSATQVSAAVVNQIKALPNVKKVKRYSGKTASGRAIEASKPLGVKKSDTVIIATQKSFADALSISPYAYATKSPILYAEDTLMLPTATIAHIKSSKFKKAIIVGGTVAIPKSVEKQLTNAGIKTSNITRLAGSNAYQTSNIIADWATGKLKNGTGAKTGDLYKYANIRFQPTIKLSINKVGVATRKKWYDALAAAALCGRNHAVLLLEDDSNYTNVNITKKNKAGIVSAYVFGGEIAVSPRVFQACVNSTK